MKEKVRCLDCDGIKSAPAHLHGHRFNPPPKVGGFGQQRQSLPKRSERMERYYEEVRRPAVAEAVGDGRKPCQIMSPVCTGLVESIHEIVPRGRAGGLIPAMAAGPTVDGCNPCNGYCSQNPLWAAERGLLRHAPPSAKIVPRRQAAPREERPEEPVRRRRLR